MQSLQSQSLRCSRVHSFTSAPRPVTRCSLRVACSTSDRNFQRAEEVPSAVTRVAHACVASIAALTVLASGVSPALARPEGVNRPDLLPKGEVTSVIDVAGFLTPSEEKRIITEVSNLEKDTGFKLRVLAQNYPETPGLAIREYWGVDDNTVVFVADPTFGDILNFNVGAGIDLEVPRSFWGRLAGKYGNKFYWQENGEAASILNAVSAIDTCLREEPGRFKCSTVQGDFGEKATSGPFGKAFGLDK
ncbi:hypothetical protein CHLRE_15g636050v5 [Chlamydomonas reinhardtii]|uniref:TPM domain-containing protein n=1 Tax=Chlamydomonas reinhardtii TaxID=3055 RepID=A8JDW2_CHLRE|nr:uncharacterized protein CHLRE_15g636050v5 [Chlamydomonas reinhardtii]PNW72625.1 hypothetical protein CHLRE_15g636050v5 [Chlamydomonas reinhardtii]|eukprot:XP_001700629.1 predicted protein [Chlamydomonas reinhardtii]